jgi:hypothetical protein
MLRARCVAPLTAATVLCACEPRLTADEARIAATEAALSSQAEALTSGSIEIATDFTLGEAVATAAEQIRDFIAAELPCAEVSLSAGQIEVEYGALPGDCTFRGHTFTGHHSITVSRNELDDVVVEHEWTELSNGLVSVSGEATVTWTLDAPSRRVVHHLEWTRLADGRSGVGDGDRTQRPLDGDLASGIVVDGVRSWEGARGEWELSINSVELRWIDPVPQAGSYSLATPFDKTVTVGFDRVDEDTIEVTVAGSGRREFHFDVSRNGAID